MKYVHRLLILSLLFAAGCGPTAKDPYVAPEDLPVTEGEGGESVLPEDGGP